MFGKLNHDEIEELIKQQLVGRLGCHADGITYIVPLSYGYDGSYIYCRGFEGMKMDLMRKNPRVCFQVDNIKDTSNWQSVIAWGSFEELPAGSERGHALQVLQERKLPILSSETMHLSPQWPFPSADSDDIPGIVFRICLFEKTGRFERSEEQHFFST